MMKYIVVKNEKDIRKALRIIKNKKYTDYEIGIRFEVQGKATLVFSTINRYGERIVHDPNTRRIVCNIVVHRVYPDYTKVRSGDTIDHYDILGSGIILGTVQGIYPNITNEEVLELRLRTIYLNVLDKMNDPEFYKRWMKFHDSKTGFAVVVPKKKKYKAKKAKIKSI